MSRFFYTCLLYVALPFVPLKLLWRARKQPEYRAHWRERFGFFAQKPTQPLIWLHCVSVGETRAAQPLVHALQARYPQMAILLSHGTPTGRETGQQLFGQSVMQTYLPYDTPGAVARFLAHFQPKIGLILETELWFNLIHACQQKAIPLCLVNARLSEKSAGRYQKVPTLVKNGLNALSVIAAQTKADAQRLSALAGLANDQITITGNIKFDVSAPPEMLALGANMRACFGKTRPILLCASTRADGQTCEESLILQQLTLLKTTWLKSQNCLLVLVPRHPQRFEEVAQLIEKSGFSYVRRSQIDLKKPLPANCQIVLGDSMQEMFAYYAACDLAFIGGSLLPLGGQNLIEALSLGKPVLIGEHTFNFLESAEKALTLGAAKRVKNAEDLLQTAAILLQSPEALKHMAHTAQAFTADNQGATEKTIALINKLLKAD